MAAIALSLLESISRPTRNSRDTIIYSCTQLLSPPHMDSAICTWPTATRTFCTRCSVLQKGFFKVITHTGDVASQRPFLDVFGHQKCTTSCQRGSPHPLLSLAEMMIKITNTFFSQAAVLSGGRHSILQSFASRLGVWWLPLFNASENSKQVLWIFIRPFLCTYFCDHNCTFRVESSGSIGW